MKILKPLVILAVNLKIIMKILITILLLMITQQPELIKGKGFIGYIFDANEDIHVYFKVRPERFTSNKQDIILCEKLLREHLNTINTKGSSGDSDDQAIQKNLKRYIRQYVGFVNEKGEKIVWINMLWWGSCFMEDAGQNIIHVSDGGNFYWNVKVNLNESEVYDLMINGLG